METSTDAEIAALLTARRVLHVKLRELHQNKRPKSEKKLSSATAPLLADLQNNSVTLRATIAERVWRDHPDWRRARVADQRQVMDLTENVYREVTRES